jgi:Tfp pilus assembly protein PilW
VWKVVSDRRGFTTTELIVASLFAIIVLATLYGFYRDQLYNLLSQEAKTATLEEARGALDLMVRELRNAGAWATGSAPAGCARIKVVTATQIQIQADPDGNNNCTDTGDDVTYAYFSVGTTSCPAGRIARNGICLVGNVVLPAGTDFLTYYSAGGTTPLSHPIADYDSIKRVKIALAVRLQNPNPKARAANPTLSTTLSSSVEFRN